MRVNDYMIGRLRETFADYTSQRDKTLSEIVMPGGWLNDDGKLLKDDINYLYMFIAMLNHLQMPVYRKFNLTVMDMNAGEDYLQDPPPADLVVIAYIANTLYAGSGDLSKQMLGRNSVLQSPLNTSRDVWEQACLESGAKVVGTVFTPHIPEMNIDPVWRPEVCPADFNDENYRLKYNHQAAPGEKRDLALLVKTDYPVPSQ